MPDDDMFWKDDRGYYVVEQDVGETISAAYSSLTGINYILRHGKLSGA
jgi:hypothetical protein